MPDPRAARPRVLVLGVYLTFTDTHVANIISRLRQSRDWLVDQRWIAIGPEVNAAVADVTVVHQEARAPKFALLNRLLTTVDAGQYEFVLVCDDDIALPEAFLDRYLALVQQYDFSLAQPARTHDSYIDHPFVEQLDGLTARHTRFVEIGPLFSVRRDAAALLLPFDERSPMGWGYDQAWPCVIEAAGLRMGIVDAVPVSHALRKPVAHYRHAEADQARAQYLATMPHLPYEEAFFIRESHA